MCALNQQARQDGYPSICPLRRNEQFAEVASAPEPAKARPWPIPRHRPFLIEQGDVDTR